MGLHMRREGGRGCCPPKYYFVAGRRACGGKGGALMWHFLMHTGGTNTNRQNCANEINQSNFKSPVLDW